MPNPLIGLVGAGAATSVIGANKQSKAVSQASDAQVQSTALALEEQRRQFDAVQEMLAPFVSGGTEAFMDMADLVGINGGNPQAAAIEAIQASPMHTAALEAGENAILANASATGGLRGGNTEQALATLGPQILADQVTAQYGRLGGLAGMGQASAAGSAAASQNFANSSSNLLQQQGAAIAGGALGQAQAFQNGLGGINQALGFGGSFITPPQGASIFGKWGF